MHEPRLFRRGFVRGGFCSRHRQSVTRACCCSRCGIFFVARQPRTWSSANSRRNEDARCPTALSMARRRSAQTVDRLSTYFQRRPVTVPRQSAARQRTQASPNSNDAKHLRPHGDHAEKQSDRRQCQSLLGDSANHCSAPSLERIGNIVHTLFAEKNTESRIGSGSEKGQFVQTAPGARNFASCDIHNQNGGLGEIARRVCPTLLASRLLIDLRRVGTYPVHSLILGRKALDAPLVALMVSYDDVPPRPRLVLEGHHYWFFVRICCHSGNMRFGRLRRYPEKDCLPPLN